MSLAGPGRNLKGLDVSAHTWVISSKTLEKPGFSNTLVHVFAVVSIWFWVCLFFCFLVERKGRERRKGEKRRGEERGVKGRRGERRLFPFVLLHFDYVSLSYK